VAPYNQPQWIVSVLRALGEQQALKLVVITEKEQLAIAPLYRRGGIFSAYDQLGVVELGEPGNMLSSERLLRQLTDALASNRITLALSRVPKESPLIRAIQDSYAGSGLAIVRERTGCPYISLVDDTAGVDEILSSSLKRDLKRARKCAESEGIVSLKVHVPRNEKELAPIWEQALDIEASGWKGESGTALREAGTIRSFYEQYALLACENGELRICFLCLDDKPIAMQIAVMSHNRFWLLKIGYDASYAKCSPGMLLMYETLQYAKNEGMRSYEFLGYANDWTRRWTKTERGNVAIQTYPYTFKGMVRLGMDFTRNAVYRLRDLSRAVRK